MVRKKEAARNFFMGTIIAANFARRETATPLLYMDLLYNRNYVIWEYNIIISDRKKNVLKMITTFFGHLC